MSRRIGCTAAFIFACFASQPSFAQVGLFNKSLEEAEASVDKEVSAFVANLNGKVCRDGDPSSEAQRVDADIDSELAATFFTTGLTARSAALARKVFHRRVAAALKRYALLPACKREPPEFPYFPDFQDRTPLRYTLTDSAFEALLYSGVSSTRSRSETTSVSSAGVPDPVTSNAVSPSGTGFVGGVGASATLGQLSNPFGLLPDTFPGTYPTSRYAPEAKNAYAAYFPLKAPPKPSTPRSMLTYGVDVNVYFFAGGDQNITGIPGGPFGTATGIDTFKISNNYMFTVGGWITAPITPTLRVSLTGGFAELNQTVKYNCVTFCAVAPATPAFTASQDKWVAGGYVGGRLAMPVALPGFSGANIGFDYKHVFFGDYNVALGTVPTRQVNARVSPDVDLATVRLAIPLR